MTDQNKPLTFDEYQEQTASTAIYPEAGEGTYNALQYVALGLIGEAGEFAGKVKKIYRDNGGVVTTEIREALKQELGDVGYYFARAAEELDERLSSVAQGNLDKLADRKDRGVLGGSGDNR